MLHSIFMLHSNSSGNITRPTQEVAYMLPGKLDLVIHGRDFAVGSSDNFRSLGEAHEWLNP